MNTSCSCITNKRFYDPKKTHLNTFIRIKSLDMSDDSDSVWCGLPIWTDGENIYYSYDTARTPTGGSRNFNFVLNKETHVWEEKKWNGQSIIGGFDVWTDGTNIYYNNRYGNSTVGYILNKETETWEEKNWNIQIDPRGLWTDGTNIYYSFGENKQYVLNKETGAWEEKVWNGLTIACGRAVCCINGKIYYLHEKDSYVLDEETDTWEKKIWGGISDFGYWGGSDVWTDGTNVYLNATFPTVSYILNGDTWEEFTWGGLNEFEGVEVWTDGTFVFCNDITDCYLLLPVAAKLYQKVDDSTSGGWVHVSEIGGDTESDSSGGGASFDNGYAVTFMSQGAAWAVSGITPGQAVQRPTSPTKDGAYFNGWYTGEDGSGEKISFPYTPTADATLYAKFSQATVVGVTGVMNEEGSLTLTDDIAGMEGYEEAQNGDYVSVTSKLSEAFPFCEIEEFTDDEGNAFVKFPKLWMKWETDASDQITGYKFANYQADSDFFIPDAFLDPNYVTTDTYLDYFALGKYEMSGSTSKGYSKSGATCLVNVTRANARAAARAYGNSSNLYNGYQMLDFAQMTLYNLLCMMFFQTTNIQKVYGGRTGSGTVTSWSAASVTGTTDGVDGLNGWNVTTDCVKLLGVENPFGNVFKWVDGAYFSKGVIYAHRFPQQFNDGTTNGTALGFERPTSSGYITALKKGTANKTRSYVYAAAIGGDAGQYCGDYTYYSSTGTVLYAGGYWNDGGGAGLWCLDGNSDASYSSSSIGARLSYRPL